MADSACLGSIDAYNQIVSLRDGAVTDSFFWSDIFNSASGHRTDPAINRYVSFLLSGGEASTRLVLFPATSPSKSMISRLRARAQARDLGHDVPGVVVVKFEA